MFDKENPEQVAAVAAILSTVTIESGPPVGAVDKETGDREPWPHVAFDVTLKRNGRTVWAGPYRFGVGHFAPKETDGNPCRLIPGAVEFEQMFYAWRGKPNAGFRDVALWAKVAEAVARKRGFAPTVSDILPALFSDGSAHLDAQDFADWASDLGYSDDSIKALGIYNACLATGRALARAFSAQEIEILRDWANEQ